MAEIGGEMAEIGGQMAEISGITCFLHRKQFLFLKWKPVRNAFFQNRLCTRNSRYAFADLFPGSIFEVAGPCF